MLYPTLTPDESKLEVIFLCVSSTRTRLMLLHKLKLEQLCHEALTSITAATPDARAGRPWRTSERARAS